MDVVTIQELLQGKPTIIKNKEFYQTRNYVEPFLERMSTITNDFRIKVKVPEQMTFSKDAQDLTYNRVLIEAVLPKEHSIDGHDEVIGFLYGIDVKKPVVKIYRGYLNQACTNLTVFNPQWIDIQELIPGDPINYNSVKHLMEQTSDFAIKLKKMKETEIDRSSIEKQEALLGHWTHATIMENQDYGFGKVKIAVSTPIDAYKQLFLETDSEYYIPQGINPSVFDVYNSFTQIVTDDKKDLMNKFEKTMIINRLLGL